MEHTETRLSAPVSPCGYCGHPIALDGAAPERFGERFCSESHADEFAARVRAARVEAAARRAADDARPGAVTGSACALPPPGQRSWRSYVGRAACWGAPALVLLAIPLVSSGGLAAAGGSLLSVVGLLACPLGMYLMMRTMMRTPRAPEASEGERRAGDRHEA